MAEEKPPSILKDLQELQKTLSLLIESFQNNPKVVAFVKSPVGQYLDRHPFLALTVLVFVAVSAVPVGFFVFLVVLTSLAGLVGVILVEGLFISVGGIILFFVLCGLGFVSLAMSGTIIVSYVVVSSLISYWFSPRGLGRKHQEKNDPLFRLRKSICPQPSGQEPESASPQPDSLSRSPLFFREYVSEHTKYHPDHPDTLEKTPLFPCERVREKGSLIQQNPSINCQLAMKSTDTDGLGQE